MAKSRPQNVNFAKYAKLGAEDANRMEAQLAKAGLQKAEYDAIKAGLNRPATPFGETNLKKGDILYFPKTDEEIRNCIRDSIFENNNPTATNPNKFIGVRSIFVAEEKGGHRLFNVSALLASVVDKDETTHTAGASDELKNCVLGLESKEAQYKALGEFLDGKALLVKERHVYETKNLTADGKPQMRSIYDFEVLEN